MLYMLYCYTIATVILYAINSVFFAVAWVKRRQADSIWFAVMFAAYVVEIAILLAGDIFSHSAECMFARVIFRAVYCYIYSKLALCLVKYSLRLWQELALVAVFFSTIISAVVFGPDAGLFCAALPMVAEITVGVICLHLLSKKETSLSNWELRLSKAFSVILVVFAAMVGVERILKLFLPIFSERNFSSELFGLAHIILGFAVLTHPHRINKRRKGISPELATHYGLTRREVEIVNKLLMGFTNQEICDSLFISQGTVKAHMHNIYQKLGVQSRSELLTILKNGRFIREKEDAAAE